MSRYTLMPYHRNEMDRFINNFTRDVLSPMQTFASAFNTDIIEEGDHYLLEAELPGFDKKDISVDVEGDQLVIRAAREESTEEEEKNYVHRERHYGTYTRRFDIVGIDVEKIGAKYEDGILKLTLPKQEPQEPEGKKISIE